MRQAHQLYGVVFSVADWIDQQGYDTTCGIAKLSLKPADSTAVFVKALMDLQATPLFRSSVCQASGLAESSCWLKECCNNTWGRALNPHKKEFSTGGSCGGEAALVTTFSVGLGIAVDQFGCARYPATCCGIAAFKPTSTRVSSIGIKQAS